MTVIFITASLSALSASVSVDIPIMQSSCVMISGWVCTVFSNDTMDKHFICALALKMIIDDLHRISCSLIDVLLALSRWPTSSCRNAQWWKVNLKWRASLMPQLALHIIWTKCSQTSLGSLLHLHHWKTFRRTKNLDHCTVSLEAGCTWWDLNLSKFWSYVPLSWNWSQSLMLQPWWQPRCAGPTADTSYWSHTHFISFPSRQ